MLDIKKYAKIPEGYQILERLPEDPADCITFGIMYETAMVQISAHSIPVDKAIPFNVEHTIEGTRHFLSPDQALIEAGNGKTAEGNPFVYTIVKMKMEPSGVQYILHLNEWIGDECFQIHGQFVENGMTGMRDTTIYSYLRQEGILKEAGDPNWWRDPYDDNDPHPFKMNLSELEQFDEAFPGHPLSLCRDYLKTVIE